MNYYNTGGIMNTNTEKGFSVVDRNWVTILDMYLSLKRLNIIKARMEDFSGPQFRIRLNKWWNNEYL